MPEFVAMSVDCPAICTLYEGYNSENPSSLPEASDPSFYSFNKFTGELVVKTKNTAYSGNVIPLTVECVANRQFMGYFSYAFQLDFNIPNGCSVTFNYSDSIISDQMLVWGEQKSVPAFNTYAYNSHNVCDGYTITYEAVQLLPTGLFVPLPSEITFNQSTRTFNIKKCVIGDPAFNLDRECTSNMMPYTKPFNIVVVATIQTDLQTFSNSANRFRVVVTPDCRADALDIRSEWNAFEYFITSASSQIL